ncbi:type I restriction enzyme HsdR N-terminal domain-containing protein [Rhizobium sp. NTR19]|uniref:Type I restriction enzyme HsdR N-terminal domain-containing protein n=1 Tax=Neorhizobium turbinariae TaxID=2937795 RepID=A0ABT0ISU1_9HYPH|nr:type I restriction endonuclease [Neorhizobium turbinariae]MCK8780920.1 type I restriction enzyme HsdR N-terminal domain-containing protein [Neorhizobium turbinariae]
MSTIEESLRAIAERVKSHSSTMATEEAVKTAVVLPFLRALGYDVFDPSEVVPEFTADAVGKKGEKVDYAIKIDNEIRILIECKPISVTLEKKHLDQLYRYFSVTNAKFAILTNGRTFNFYTDLDAPNKLDAKPFFVFDVADFNAGIVSELKKFEKASFDVGAILATAERLKYTSGVKQVLSKLIEDPSDEFVRMVSSGVYEGRMTQQVRETFTGIVRSAFREVIMDTVKSRLSNALADTEEVIEKIDTPVDEEPDIVTTDEEREGFMIVKAIVRDTIKATRVTMRDQKTYCGILIDNNNRKPLARLWFNRSVKYIGLFDGEVEERLIVESLDKIYDYSERLRATARKYAEA